MKKKQLETLLYSFVGIAAMFLIIVAINIILGVVKTRVDLTREKAYTLSQGTKAILKKLDTSVEIRFYCTQSEKERKPVATIDRTIALYPTTGRPQNVPTISDTMPSAGMKMM